MAILFDSKAKTFTLQTKKSTYQMKIDEQGVLLHTYFGAGTDESDYSYLIVPDDHQILLSYPFRKELQKGFADGSRSHGCFQSQSHHQLGSYLF